MDRPSYPKCNLYDYYWNNQENEWIPFIRKSKVIEIISNILERDFINKEHNSRYFAESFKKTKYYHSMDINNQKIINIMAEKGEKAAINQMFKHPENGRPMSYSEMRMIYG
jgi:hypothetical protein